MPSDESFAAHLARLEADADGAESTDVVLWPRTPIDVAQIQARIAQRVGASDLRRRHPLSRARRIPAVIADLARAGAIDPTPTIVDIACGDGLVLAAVQRRVPNADCHGVDLHVDGFASHQMVRDTGVRLWRVPIQELFVHRPPQRLDVAIMLNTYRGWESADLRADEVALPSLADAWFDAAARYVLVTMLDTQVTAWRDCGYAALDLGPGEDDSRLVLLSREVIPGPVRSSARRRLILQRPFELLRGR